MYLYWGLDKGGKTVDFYLSQRRDVSAARAFLHAEGDEGPTDSEQTPRHRAVAHLKDKGERPKRVLLRSSKYLGTT
jgi:transposase-like protein